MQGKRRVLSLARPRAPHQQLQCVHCSTLRGNACLISQSRRTHLMLPWTVINLTQRNGKA